MILKSIRFNSGMLLWIALFDYNVSKYIFSAYVFDSLSSLCILILFRKYKL